MALGDENTSPRRDGAELKPPWTHEGRDLSRVLALSDGVFAFALTLLVLGLALPAGMNPPQIGSVLQKLEPAFLAYLLSFGVIFLYWRTHHQLFQYITSYDQRMLALNIGFLFFIAVMPFVTNLLAWAPTQRLAVDVYALTQVACGGTLTALWLYASRSYRHLNPAVPPDWVRFLTRRLVLSPAVFAASLPLAFWNPLYSEYSWLGLFVVQALVRFRARRTGSPPAAVAPSA